MIIVETEGRENVMLTLSFNKVSTVTTHCAQNLTENLSENPTYVYDVR